MKKNKKNKKNKINPYSSFSSPLIRRVFPELIANNVVSIQPMSAPTGLVFAMKYLYGDADLFSFEDYGDDYDLYTWEDYDEEE